MSWRAIGRFIVDGDRFSLGPGLLSLFEGDGRQDILWLDVVNTLNHFKALTLLLLLCE